MLVEQYVYFALGSELVSAVEMAREIGLDPDEVMVRGSRRPAVPLPRTHAWKVVCRDPDLFLHQQIAQVVERLEPYADRIGELATRLDVREEDVTACLQIVREYTALGEGEEPPALNFLGWSLDRRTLTFLERTGAIVDVDEYGY